ncbi:apoptosis regulatory protein Siva-like [Drosophila miranda]|uniref:apoptosis regulatory protein Siva-like n=1 Tax=Drosophila miranda TaxID=7229 RepID=UPI00143F7A7A|nr:apoptosis regulatory protein Siva-like [Drosophila miranda]
MYSAPAPVIQQAKSVKRSRSPTEDTLKNNKTQSKVLVTQKISDASDPEKMKQEHEKTKMLLFAGAVAAAAASPSSDGTTANGATTNAGNGTNAPSTGQHMLYGLTGNGSISIRNMAIDIVNPRLERKRSRCCQRQTLIHDRCGNCTNYLCEECGYSCRECSKFICRACVTVFGNHFDEADDPLCERCQMYYA